MNDLIPVSDIEKMAVVAAKSNMFGFRNTEEAMAIMLLCQAENMHPAIAMRDYHVIQGRPALKADAMLARFQSAGGKVEWKEYSDRKVTGVFTHPQGGSLLLSWTIEQAQAIGLVKPGSGWAKFPRAMLRSRVVSEGIRTVYPGCVTGVYTPEEVADFEPSKPIKTVEATPVYAEVLEDDTDDSDKEWTVYLPDGAVYSRHDTAEEWVDAYAGMVAKIRSSKKLGEDAKKAKVRDFMEANAEGKKKLAPEQIINLLRLTQEHQEEEHSEP